MSKVATTGEVAQRFSVLKGDKRHLQFCGCLGYNGAHDVAPRCGGWSSLHRTGQHALKDDHTESIATALVESAQASWPPLPKWQLLPLESTAGTRPASGTTEVPARLIFAPGGSRVWSPVFNRTYIHQSGQCDTSFAPGDEPTYASRIALQTDDCRQRAKIGEHIPLCVDHSARSSVHAYA